MTLRDLGRDSRLGIHANHPYGINRVAPISLHSAKNSSPDSVSMYDRFLLPR